MSANKFKVGDKVKVRKGLVADEYYGCVRCDILMAVMGGELLTIDCVKSDYYEVNKNRFSWSDEMLEPAEKTLDNLSTGDFITSYMGGSDITVKILASLDGCYLISYAENHDAATSWYTAAELDRIGYRPVKPDTSKPTIEIGGKKYKKADVEEAIKDLEVVE